MRLAAQYEPAAAVIEHPGDRLRKLAERAGRKRPPCDGCRHRERCLDERLSCAAFSQYVQLRSYPGVSRRPTRERFDRLFSGREGQAGA